jgi:hypothetical protein
LIEHGHPVIEAERSLDWSAAREIVGVVGNFWEQPNPRRCIRTSTRNQQDGPPSRRSEDIRGEPSPPNVDELHRGERTFSRHTKPL